MNQTENQHDLTSQLTRDKGTYILVMRLSNKTRLSVGQLGEYDLISGWYCYVGSAFGSGGLKGRLRHHLSPIIKPHWHIDYLRRAASVDAVWYLANETRYEHQWAESLRSQKHAAVPIPRFGASDCHCRTHLIYFSDEPTIAAYFHADKLCSLHI